MTNEYRIKKAGDISNATLLLSMDWVNKAYSGNSVNLRRVSDDANSDFGFVDGEIDWDSIDTWRAGSNVFIETWYDQSGYGNNATQTTADANQPQLDTVNKKIIFLASGTSYLEVADGTTINVNGGDWSLIMDANLKGFNNQGSTINCPIAKESGQYANTSYGFILDSFNKMYFKNGASSGTANVAITTSARKTFIGTETSDNVVMYEDNVSIATGSSQTGASDNSTNMLIGRASEADRYVDMDLYGISLYKGLSLPESDRELYNN